LRSLENPASSFLLFSAHYLTVMLTVVVCWAEPEEPLMVTVYVTGGVLVMLWLVSPPHATWNAKLENIMLASTIAQMRVFFERREMIPIPISASPGTGKPNK
jgi:alpha-beta hydrolase superfamily lysophospholipase